MKKDYLLRNTRLSPPAFFNDIKKHNDGLFLIEDIESTLSNKSMLDLLRGALWGQIDKHGNQVRIVTYSVSLYSHKIQFNGQVIFTGNKPLTECPVVNAVATRINQYHLMVEREEMIAL